LVRVADGIKGFPRPLSIGEVYEVIGNSRVNPRSPYDCGFGYCSLCDGWWRLDEVPRNRRGWPMCPVHRRQLRLRTKAARRSWKPVHGPKTCPEVVLDE